MIIEAIEPVVCPSDWDWSHSEGRARWSPWEPALCPQACYQAASPALARLLRDDIVATYGTDFEACIAHLMFPLAHRRAVRITNMLSGCSAKRGGATKVITHTFGERAMLKVMFAALMRAAERWRAIKMTEFERH